MAVMTAMIYGQSGTGKTSLLAAIAKYLAQLLPGTRSRAVTCEEYPALKASEHVDVWPVDGRKFPFETLQQAVEGWWPADPADPLSVPLPPKDKLRGINAYFFEGTATMGDFMLGGYSFGGLSARIGRGEKIGTEEGAFRFDENTIHVGGVSRSHYHLVQKRMLDLIICSRRLPTLVFWTGHEIRVTDDSRPGFFFIGVEVVGQAATHYINRNVANVFHLTNPPSGVKQGGELIPEYKLYVQDHYPTVGDLTTPFKAKIQVPDQASLKDCHPIKGTVDQMASSLLTLLTTSGGLNLQSLATNKGA